MDRISEAIREFQTFFPEGKFTLNDQMKNHTTLRIGGIVPAFFEPVSVEELKIIISLMKKYGLRYLVVGNGSNLLFADGKVDIVVITTRRINRTSVEGTKLYGEVGASLANLAYTAYVNSLTGLEFAAGIPGTLGGGVRMNAGAHGSEIKNVVKNVRVLTSDLSEKVFTNSQCLFEYRHSRFFDGENIILSAEMELEQGNSDEIKAKMDSFAAKRKETQPLNFPSAGSTFKRPENGYASAMIDQAGLKGYRVGGAQVSEKHAGFLINAGGATFKDFVELMGHVQDEVYKKFGVLLEPEVEIIE